MKVKVRNCHQNLYGDTLPKPAWRTPAQVEGESIGFVKLSSATMVVLVMAMVNPRRVPALSDARCYHRSSGDLVPHVPLAEERGYRSSWWQHLLIPVFPTAVLIALFPGLGYNQ